MGDDIKGTMQDLKGLKEDMKGIKEDLKGIKGDLKGIGEGVDFFIMGWNSSDIKLNKVPPN